jgi:hypothetical protein
MRGDARAEKRREYMVFQVIILVKQGSFLHFITLTFLEVTELYILYLTIPATSTSVKL